MEEITVKAEIDNIHKVTEFVESILEGADCPAKVCIQISLCVDELFSNIAHYSYPDREGDATVAVEVRNDEKTAEITFCDSGIPYNPLEKEDPDTTLSADERPIGGLGIFLVKKNVDDIIYEYRDGKNVLKIRKNW